MSSHVNCLRPTRVRLLEPLLCLIVVLLCPIPSNGQPADSLENALKGATETERLSLHLKLADVYASKDWETAVEHARQAWALSDSFGNDSMQFVASYTISKSFLGLGDYDSALAHGTEALQKVFSQRSRASALHNLAWIFESKSEFQKSLEYYLEALKIHQSLSNKKGEANTLNSLSFVYKAMGRYEDAMEALLEAKRIYELEGNQSRAAGITFNVGLITMEMKKYEEAIPYFRAAMKGLREEQEPRKFSAFYNNLANCYEKMLNKNPAFYDSALYYGKKNLALKKQLKDYRGIANAHNGLAATYERNSDYTHSYNHSLASLSIADSLDMKEIKKNALSYLITAQIGLRKFDLLNDRFEELLDITNELNKESNSRTINELATKYETEKKEGENQRLQMVNTQQARLNWALGSGGAMLLLMLGFLGYFYRDKQIANKKLESQKQMIESNLREKEALLREIHHRVKNNLQVISSLLNMQSYYLDDPRMISAIAEGQNRVKAMALIHQKLYQTEHLSEIDFQEYTEQLIGHLATAFHQPGKEIKSSVNGSALKLDIDTAIPLGLILNELITNAYKYAFQDVEKGNLKVDLTRDDLSYFHLHISDSGQGLPADFSEEKLNSLGLKLVRMLIEQLDGSLTISNEPGASFYIRFRESRLSA